MAKIIQLAKDLLKGGSKEDVYPKTVDSAVYITDSNGVQTAVTLKHKLSDVDSSIDNLYYNDTKTEGQIRIATDILIGTTQKIPASGNYSGHFQLDKPTKNGYTKANINDAIEWFKSGKRVLINTLDNKGYFTVINGEAVDEVYDADNEEGSKLSAIRMRSAKVIDVLSVEAEDEDETSYYVTLDQIILAENSSLEAVENKLPYTVSISDTDTSLPEPTLNMLVSRINNGAFVRCKLTHDNSYYYFNLASAEISNNTVTELKFTCSLNNNTCYVVTINVTTNTVITTIPA